MNLPLNIKYLLDLQTSNDEHSEKLTIMIIDTHTDIALHQLFCSHEEKAPSSDR